MTPESVSTPTTGQDESIIDSSKANLTRHLIPLPHINPLEPSALNIIMRKSATLEDAARIMPSEPIPLCLSLMLTASSDQS